MAVMQSSYTYTRQIRAADLEAAVETVKSVFGANGWGLPPGTTDIAFNKVFAAKGVDPDFRPTHLLGFCHPATAHTVLTKEPSAAVLLPCNVAVAKVEDDIFEVASMSPMQMGALMDNADALKEIIAEVNDKILAALDALPAP